MDPDAVIDAYFLNRFNQIINASFTVEEMMRFGHKERELSASDPVDNTTHSRKVRRFRVVYYREAPEHGEPDYEQRHKLYEYILAPSIGTAWEQAKEICPEGYFPYEIASEWSLNQEESQ